MSDIYPKVLKFMQGHATAQEVVMGGLECLEMVIIRLGTSEIGYRSNGGPYIMLWRTECDRTMIWGSRDDFFADCAYRMTCDEGANIKLRQSLVNLCKDKFTAVHVDLSDYSGFIDLMREDLDLDSDLYRGGRTDREIAHGQIKQIFESVSLLAPSADTAQQSQVSQSGESKMSNKITSIVNQAKAATVTAAEIQAGKALNIAAVKAAKSKAPMMIRGYMDHPAAPAVIALAVVSAAEFMPAGPAKVKITKAANLMLTAAVIEGADKFLDLEGMIDKVFAGLPTEAKALIDA